jgi:5-methylthioadenosine/S-adenosylhomocysteine deaminase
VRQVKMTPSVRLMFLIFLGASVFVGQSLAQTSSTIHKEKVDLLINGGTIVTMDGDRLILEDGALVVKGDVISAIGFRTDLEKKYIADQTIDAREKLVLPGFINGHTHVPMTLFRGLHDDVTLDDWLHKYIFPAEAKNVTEEFVRWGTRLAAAEQIRGGITTFADMYYFEDKKGGYAGRAGRDVYRFSRAG